MARGKSDGGVTKVEMVRTALEELGAKAKPMAIHEFVKSKYNVDLSKIIISNYKSTMKKKGKRRGRPAGSKNAAPVAASAGGKGIRLEDLAAVRGLVGRLGAGQLRQLVDVLA